MLSWLKRIFGGGAPDPAGVRGEKLAADFLRRERGMTIVARNWRSPHDRRDEIDLVCRDGEALVFVEVKTRSAAALVPGVHAVNTRKKTVLRRAAKAYLSYLPEKPRAFRLDVVEVALPVVAKGGADVAKSKRGADEGKGEPEILHFENVGLFSKYDQG